MNLDRLLDAVESRPVRIVALALIVAVATWAVQRHYSVDARVARVCSSLYRAAHTVAESTAVDTSRTAVRAPDNTVVVSEPCGELRLAGRLK